jgi:4-alpha-glucanotransferase
MNIPGTVGNNWLWRFKKETLTEAIKEKLKLITKDVNRI